ncbi:hypothetical protein OAF54_00125 [bacterium]|nr:hypothetical protein [bacterium]
MSILDHCLMPPRPVQVEVLTQVEKTWDDTDVYLIIAPVASGKSLIADTIAKWSNKGTSIITPDNLLVQQYTSTFNLHTIRPKHTYKGAGYNIAKYKSRGASCVFNYITYMANRAYNHCLIIDEAHNMVDHLRGTAKLWKHLYGIPENMYTVDDLMEWLELPHKLPVAKQEKLAKFREALLANPDRYIIETAVETYRNQPREVLKLVDVIPRDNPPIYWPPGRVKKLVLMSATISKEDVYDLGLDDRRVTVIDVDSPIPAENRPIIYRPIDSMSYHNVPAAAPKVMDWVVKMQKLRKGQRGLIHTTYSMVRHLKKALKDRHGDCPNIMFHTKWDKQEKLEQWLNSDLNDSKVLVGCGMTTGLSLDHDKARWSAIVNLPFANLKDRAVRANLERRPANYAWQTIRHVLQASGRTTRTPTDWSDCFILDSRFPKLYKEHSGMWPEWFRHGLEEGGGLERDT